VYLTPGRKPQEILATVPTEAPNSKGTYKLKRDIIQKAGRRSQTILDPLILPENPGGPMWNAIEMMENGVSMTAFSNELKEAIVYTLVHDGYDEAKLREKLGTNVMAANC